MPESQVETNKMSWWRTSFFITVVTVLLFAGYVYATVFKPVVRGGVVIVRPGATLKEVVTEMHAQGLVNHPLPVILVARLTRIGNHLKAGGYTMGKVMSPYQMLQKIASGKVDLIRVTLPEGFTIDQIAAKLQARGLGSAVRFRSLAYHPAGRLQLPPWVPTGSLEGFLFPDTYFVPLHETEEKIIARMLQSFETVVLKPLQPEIASNSLGLQGIVTLASLVEREARAPEERPLIAGVLMNRLRQRKRLECDATVQYALGQHKKRLLYSDLQVDSPYNTYRHVGLPPGPIANPGLSCIKAALQPEKTDYLFYVARPDGRHVFSRTLSEHNKAVRRVRTLKG